MRDGPESARNRGMNRPIPKRLHERQRRVRAASILLSAFLVVVPAATRPPRMHAYAAPGQSTLAGRYILRSVNGQRLPVTLAGDDPRHTIRVTDGVLELNPDGSYVCRTLATASSFGLKEPFADTLLGGYTLVTPGAIQFNHKGLRPDTILASGFQITWTHPVRTLTGVFLYSK
jgi:hypothetical protein